MILDQIVASVRDGLAKRKQQMPPGEVELQADRQGTPRDFEAALRGEDIKLIAEVKRASPSKGWLCRDLDVATLVRSYARGGAAAISVLTEPTWFKGSLDDLAKACQATHLPGLCKNFILEPYQVYEARAYGADALLLIVAILSQEQMEELLSLSYNLGLSCLVEVHNEGEVEKALSSGAEIIGINNRDLDTFAINIGTTQRLRPFIPSGRIVVSESGINNRGDVEKLKGWGVNAMLVGEALVTANDIPAKIKELIL